MVHVVGGENEIQSIHDEIQRNELNWCLPSLRCLRYIVSSSLIKHDDKKSIAETIRTLQDTYHRNITTTFLPDSTTLHIVEGMISNFPCLIRL